MLDFKKQLENLDRFKNHGLTNTTNFGVFSQLAHPSSSPTFPMTLFFVSRENVDKPEIITKKDPSTAKEVTYATLVKKEAAQKQVISTFLQQNLRPNFYRTVNTKNFSKI